MSASAISAAVESTASLEYPAFKKAILNATRVVEKRNTIPILTTVLIRACNGGVHVVGTDLDIYTTTFVAGAVSRDFVALLDVHKLKSLMDKVKDASRINFTMGDDTLIATIGKLKLNLRQDYPEADFPSDMAFLSAVRKSNVSFTIRSSALLLALSKIEFAISTEETRYYLNGVFMHFHERNNMLTFVATDGHRLGRYEIAPPEGCQAIDEDGAIIPRKTVSEVVRLLKRPDCPPDVVVYVTKSGISFTIGDDEVVESKLIDGTFPDYQRVLPPKNETKVAARTAAFIDALKQASAISSVRGKAIKLSVDSDILAVSCTDPEFGTVSTDFSTQSKVTAPFEIGFNSAYLLEILGQLDGGAMMELQDAGSPAIIRDGADQAVTYVLMPTKV